MSFSANLSESLSKLGAQAVTPGTESRGAQFDIDAIRLANGAVIGWRCPDDSGERETQVGASLARIAAEAAQRLAAIDADDTRTEAWKATERAKVAAETLQRFEAARGEADKIVTEFAEADAREAVASPIAAGDHAAALVDHECRAWLRSLDADALVTLAKELTEPRHARLLEAMMRSPVPLPPWIADAARSAWIEHRMRADPQGTRLRKQAAARTEWLGAIVSQVDGIVGAMQPTSAKPTITRVA